MITGHIIAAPYIKNSKREVKSRSKDNARGKRGKFARGKSKKAWVARGLSIQFTIESPLAGNVIQLSIRELILEGFENLPSHLPETFHSHLHKAMKSFRKGVLRGKPFFKRVFPLP